MRGVCIEHAMGEKWMIDYLEEKGFIRLMIV
jgi:hypothetical protein